ncbi:MAG: hypothetical protein A2X25_03095 [Chloroflexi bacterium GWB2_49_20]|nr:MAG: hypothetical protein A2X25_03095 [Chloroflexi bacterium GWB2_49_20]OGN76084.1 MAG: hypothetical protein A2X26_11365 [Chloroflexi bacterium GWC2_49_37]OGN83470.1 MAG: hypothetical protein A2X27_09200 [Chloroflexi bacterium GWD2_49_16]HBG73869.1 hypothetical protein [Anaerolineae bacterium]HCC79552.1 hypothetical protein [Anaerolineae bacterium]
MRTNNLDKVILAMMALTIVACSALSRVASTLAPITTTPTTIIPTKITPTSLPTDVSTEISRVDAGSGDILIVNSFSYDDEWGGFHVVGEIQNLSNSPCASIELSIEIKDAEGNSLLKDENGNSVKQEKFFPLLYTLAAGEYSPFSYYYDTANGIPDTYNVAITGFLGVEVSRVKLVVENVQMVDDNAGSIYISGEIVNQSDQWAHINGFAGAVRDSNNQVVSADWSGAYATELAPSDDPGGYDRTPFIATIPDPGVDYSDWEIYIDAIADDAPEIYSLSIELTNHYFDEYDSFHIIGTVTNNSSEYLSILLIAGLYDANSVVLDADNEFLAMVVSPGAVVPFDISNFSNVNSNPEEANRIDAFKVQIDTYSTYSSVGDEVSLKSLDASVTKDGSSWSFTGTVTNTSDQNLSSETVVVVIYDGSGQIAATDYTYISPEGGVIPQGDVNSYNLYIDLDPQVDTSSFTFQVFIQGDVQ